LIPPYYEGPNSFKKPIALIIFTGLELDRVLNLIQEIEPSFLILLNPFPGTIDIVDKSRDIIEKIKSTQKINTKIEVFAILLAYLANPSFRVVYSIPMEYDTENYSKGCFEIYEFSISK
jgi:hypothetical protein